MNRCAWKGRGSNGGFFTWSVSRRIRWPSTSFLQRFKRLHVLFAEADFSVFTKRDINLFCLAKILHGILDRPLPGKDIADITALISDSRLVLQLRRNISRVLPKEVAASSYFCSRTNTWPILLHICAFARWPSSGKRSTAATKPTKAPS